MSIADHPASVDKTSLQAFRTAIAGKYELHIQAFKDANLNLLLDTFFHEDALWAGPFPTPNTVVQGRKQLEDFFVHVIDCQLIDPIVSIFSFVEGNAGFDHTVYRTRPRPGYDGPHESKNLRFHCTFNWVRTAGDWKVIGVTSYMTEVEAND